MQRRVQDLQAARSGKAGGLHRGGEFPIDLFLAVLDLSRGQRLLEGNLLDLAGRHHALNDSGIVRG